MLLRTILLTVLFFGNNRNTFVAGGTIDRKCIAFGSSLNGNIGCSQVAVAGLNTAVRSDNATAIKTTSVITSLRFTRSPLGQTARAHACGRVF